MTIRELVHAEPVLPPRVQIDPIIRDFEARLEDVAAREGYRIALDGDMRSFAAFLSRAESNDGVNPALDPSKTDHDDAFWMRVEHRGAVVGVMGERFIDCGRAGYYDLVRQGLLFDRNPEAPLPILIERPGAFGRACFGGGVYVAPEHRKRGLSWLLAQYGRAVAIRIWNLNAAYGMVFEALRANGLAESSYGGKRTLKMFEGYFPPKGGDAVVWSIEHDIPHLLDGMRETILQITLGRYEQMADLAPRRVQRKH